MKTRRTPALQYQSIEVAIYITGLLLTWLTAFLTSYIFVRIILNRRGVPWGKMNIREKTMVGHFDVIGLLVGIVVSLLYLELFRATLSPMVTFPTVVTWSMDMMFALVLGIKRAILKKG